MPKPAKVNKSQADLFDREFGYHVIAYRRRDDGSIYLGSEIRGRGKAHGIVAAAKETFRRRAHDMEPVYIIRIKRKRIGK